MTNHLPSLDLDFGSDDQDGSADSVDDDQSPTHSSYESKSSALTDDDGFEFKLEPPRETNEQTKRIRIANRSASAETLRSDIEMRESQQFSGEKLHDEATNGSIAEVRKDSYGEFPIRRNYPTLEAIQRLYVLFSYAAVAMVLPYLALECLLTIYRAEESILLDLMGFFRWAVPVLFGTAVAVGGLLGVSEGIKLFIDLQYDMWRAANSVEGSSTRRRN